MCIGSVSSKTISTGFSLLLLLDDDDDDEYYHLKKGIRVRGRG
jgi:hypothetical protein